MHEILQKDSSVLRKNSISIPIENIHSKKVQKIIADMKKTVESQLDGVAIAAPQIGEALRIFVVSHRAFELGDDEKTDDEPVQKIPDVVFINPKITKLSQKRAWISEGCLSVRNVYGKTHRADKATIEAYDENGVKFTRGASGLLAQIFQHETDHLDGILFIDHAKELEEISPEQIEKHNKHHEQL